MGGVNHAFACENDQSDENGGCPIGRANVEALQRREPVEGTSFWEGQVVAKEGEVFDPETGEAIRCTVCDRAMKVVYAALNIGRQSGGRSLIAGGDVVVDSPDRSVCDAGRKLVGSSALGVLQPGETKTGEIMGVPIRAKKSAGGRSISVERADK